MVDVRAEIKRAMKAQGRTAYWLSKASGIRMGTVYAYVGKKQDMNGEYIGKLLTALNLRITPSAKAARGRGQSRT